MDRMVYSPKAYAFTKDRTGVIRDISPYIVSGEVRRVVNAVSSAQLTLRNPEMMFTHPNADGLVTFMPMDPITIYLERLKGYPVRVFTGFLDTVPYLQLYPGTIQLEASCTLKRLQYKFFDPALPYTQSFLAYYGWIDPKQGGSVFNLDGLNDWAKSKEAGVIGSFGDGSVAELLAATMIYIGEWEENGLYIEKLPPDIFDMMSLLQAQMSDANKAALDEFNSFLKKVIGEGSHGSPDGSSANGDSPGGGGGDVTTGPVKGEKKIIETLIKSANNWQVPAEYVIATCYIESGFRSDPGSGNGIVRGWFQWDKVDGPPGSYYGWGVRRSKKNGCYDLGFSSDCFCECMRRVKNKNKSLDWLSVLEKAQGVNQSQPYNNPAYRNQIWANAFKLANKLKAKYDIGSNVPGVGETVARTAAVPTGTEDDSAITLQRASTSSTNKGDSTSGSWGYGPGVPQNIKQNLKDFLDAMATFYDHKLLLGTTTNHDYLTTSGNVSDHVGGNAADIPSGINKWESANMAPEGYKVAIAAYRAAGYSYSEAVSWAHKPNYDRHKNGKNTPSGEGTQILWGVAEHHDHVHVGVRGDIGKVGKGEVDIKISFDYTNMLPDRKPRSGKPQIIVLHSTEGENAEGISDLKQLGTILKNQGLSVHIGIDDDGNMARYVKDTDVAYHVASYNGKSLGIEQIGFAAQDSWPDAQTNATAKMVAYWANKYDIPIKHSTEHGVCRHMDLGASGGGHADPGNNYPFDEVLSKAQDYLGQVVAGEEATGDASGDSGSSDNATATAFAVEFNFPTVAESMEAIALDGNRSLMNDQPLLPFIQQLCDASLRQFQSLPDGRFYAFYPDYFGEMLHHPPYWEIDDIEVLNGGINLSDDALVTHMFVIGDTTWPNAEELINKLTTTGIVSIFDAFLTGAVTGTPDIPSDQPPATNKEADKDTGSKDAETPKGMNMLLRKDEAASFLNIFGARPVVEPMSMIKNHFFEYFVAYQRFLLAWSRQFISTFEFTFMPEIFPGGKVGFRDHGLQMYVEDVTHSWNYETGFTTTANLSAPSVYADNLKGLPPNMVRAIVSNAGQAPDNRISTPEDALPGHSAWGGAAQIWGGAK